MDIGTCPLIYSFSLSIIILLRWLFFIVLPPVLTCWISPCCSPYGHSFSFEMNWNYWTIILPIFAYDASNVSYPWPFLLSKHRGFFNRPAHELNNAWSFTLLFFYIKCTIVILLSNKSSFQNFQSAFLRFHVSDVFYRCILASILWALTSPRRKGSKVFLWIFRSTPMISARGTTASFTELFVRSRSSAIRWVSTQLSVTFSFIKNV